MLNLPNWTKASATRLREKLDGENANTFPRIHRVPEGEDDDEAGQQVQLFLGDVDPAWKWEDAEGGR